MASFPTRLIANGFNAVCFGAICCGAICFGAIGTLTNSGRLDAAEPRHRFADLEPIRYRMYHDPELLFPDSKLVISDEPIALWLRALDRPEPELQRVVADTITLAHQLGMTGLEATMPKLIELLDQDDLDLELRQAVVSALIELDSRDAIASYAKNTPDIGPTLAAVVEPALIRWKSEAIGARWLARLQDPAASPRSKVLAIEGIAAIAMTDATAPLTDWVRDSFAPIKVRMAAARALGSLHETGMTSLAKEMSERDDPSPISQLLALPLLSKHQDADSIRLLGQLVSEGKNSAIQSGALDRLYSIDPAEIYPLLETALSCKDVSARRIAAWTLIFQKQVDSIGPLSKLLDDVNPSLRREVAAALVGLAANDEIRQEVIDRTSDVLAENSWRGCEQATRVLVSLDHKPCGTRLADLLKHPRGEVMIASSWGLQQLEVEEHLPEMLEQAKSLYRGFKSKKYTLTMNGPEHQLAHLFIAFGQHRYEPAEELIRTYIPKNHDLGDRSRPAATWAIGWFYEDNAPDELVKLLLERLHDTESEFPETSPVRRMVAVSLARMNAESALPDLRQYASISQGSPGLACFWAISKFTGEEMPVPPTSTVTYSDWFLSPSERRESR